MGESSLMERGGDKGGEGGTRSKSASTNNSKIPPPSTHSGNGSVWECLSVCQTFYNQSYRQHSRGV